MYLQKENSVYIVLGSIKNHSSKHGINRFICIFAAENNLF